MTHASPTLTLAITPDKGFYRPGEAVTLHVTAPDLAGKAEVRITWLTETLATLTGDLKGGALDLIWMPPATAPRGYGASLRLLDSGGAVIASAATAFDVLTRWLDAPRYGFLSQFQDGRHNEDRTMALAAGYHLNGLQYYDWQYRHETLLPPETLYSDLLGRNMSLDTVKRLIDAGHAHNIAAMPYTAIYGASMDFYRQHPDWALFEAPDKPYLFGDNFLAIMDPTPGSPWAEHLLNEFAGVLDKTAFDGIHIDQYGAPKVGLNARGARVDLAQVFPAFIDQTADVVAARRGDSGAVIFNAVGNWPVETVAPARQSAVYIEVWPPYREFLDLHRLIVAAQDFGAHKPVIIAAYIDPLRVDNWRLADAIIFASGAYHLELGEPAAMLADPYFPKFGILDKEGQAVIRRYYDFLVRYENVLALGTTDATGERADALRIAGIETGGALSQGRVAPLVRRGQAFETFSLVNLKGVSGGLWDARLDNGPDALANLDVTIHTDRPVRRAWWASPDQDDIAPRALDIQTGTDAGGAFLRFTLPTLAYWNLIVLEYQP